MGNTVILVVRLSDICRLMNVKDSQMTDGSDAEVLSIISDVSWYGSNNNLLITNQQYLIIRANPYYKILLITYCIVVYCYLL